MFQINIRMIILCIRALGFFEDLKNLHKFWTKIVFSLFMINDNLGQLIMAETACSNSLLFF